MTRARILADYVSSGDELALKAPLSSPAFTGTPTGITAAHITSGALPVGVTGGSGLTHLASNPTVTLGSNATFPAGHVIKVTFKADEEAGNVSFGSSDYEDSGIFISHVCNQSSTNSYLVAEFFTGMVYIASSGEEMRIKMCATTSSNTTHNSANDLLDNSYHSYWRDNSINQYHPEYLRFYLGLETEMDMANIGTWNATDEIHFRIFGLKEGSGDARLVHTGSTWNFTITEIAR